MSLVCLFSLFMLLPVYIAIFKYCEKFKFFIELSCFCFKVMFIPKL